MIKRWVTGEQAGMDQDDIDRDLFEVGCGWMEVTKLKKLAKDTDVSLWKQYSVTVIALRRRVASVSERFDAH
jgi:hypothetical protein